MVNDIAVQEFVNAIKETPQDTNNTYNATVSRIDDEGIVWVNIHGSEKETPTASTSSEVKRGDSVTVSWRNNKLYIGGNYSNPSAGVIRVQSVENEATRAHEAADYAVSEAERAHDAADRAEASAEEAAQSALEAQASASRANKYAVGALNGLSTVQDVVTTLNWITQHGTMTVTTDTTVDYSHVYFVRDANGDYVVNNVHYSIVTDIAEDADPHNLGYYELSIDESLQNYVMIHLAVTDSGLWIIPNGNSYVRTTDTTANTGKVYYTYADGQYTVVQTPGANPASLGYYEVDTWHVLISNSGMTVYDNDGIAVSTFGESITFDSTREQTIGGANAYIKWKDSNNDGTADTLEIVADSVSFRNGGAVATTSDIPTKVSELTNDSGYQTSTQVSNAIATGISGKADKTAAVSEEQYIYKQAVSGTNSMDAYPSSPTETASYWVTAVTESVTTGTPPNSAAGLTPVWTTKRPSYQTNYPVIFVAKQKKTAAGVISCTTPTKDDTTTIIDGGHITTGSIDADRMSTNVVSAINATVNKIDAKNINASQITVNSLSDGSSYSTTTQMNDAIFSAVAEIEVGGRNLAVNAAGEDWYSVAITDGQNKAINLFGQTGVHDWIDLTSISGVAAGDQIQVSFDIKFSSDWAATGTGTKNSYVQGHCNGTSGTWATISFAGGNKKTDLETIMASSSKEGHISTYFTVTSAMLDGTYTGICMSNIRFDYYAGTVYVRHVMVEKGTKPSNWTPAPEDATEQEQRIYYRSNSTTAPTAPTTWVTSTATANATWTTKRMQYDSTYKYLYTCLQRKTVGGSVTNTTVLLDDTTTVIDGGNIITGTVTANQIASNSITADKIAAGAVTVGKIDPVVYTYNNAGQGTGYAKLCTISVTENYRNKAITFTLNSRNKLQTDVSWRFTNSSTPTTCTVASATYNGDVVLYYVGTSGTYTIYFGLGESYDIVRIYDLIIPYDTGLTVTWAGAYYGTSLPSGAVAFTKLAGSRTSAELDNAAKTATSYITDIDTKNGITIKAVNGTTGTSASTDNYIKLNASGLDIYKGGTSVAFYGDTARIGKDASPHVSIDSNGFHIWQATQSTASNEVASFTASSIELGKNDISSVISLCGGKGTIERHNTLGLLLSTTESDKAVTLRTPSYSRVTVNPTSIELFLDTYTSATVESNYDGTHSAFQIHADYLQLYTGYTGDFTTLWLMNQTPPQGSQTYSAIWHASANGNYGIYRPSSSSMRYKEDIKPVEDDRLDPHRLYDIEVVQFKFKEGTFEQDDPYEQDRVDVIGFIAEDVYEHYPQAAIMLHDEVENWDERYIIPPMLKLIQEQNDRITELERRLS